MYTERLKRSKGLKKVPIHSSGSGGVAHLSQRTPWVKVHPLTVIGGSALGSGRWFRHLLQMEER